MKRKPLSVNTFFARLKPHPILIVGFSPITGFSSCKLLLAYGVNVVIYDKTWNNEKKALLAKLMAKKTSKHMPVLNRHSPMVYSDLNALCTLCAHKIFQHGLISPGVPRSLPQMQRIAAFLALWGDFDFFYPLYCDKTIIAVTGTNGKTSVVKLIAHLIDQAANRRQKLLSSKTNDKNAERGQNRQALAVGNIGYPIADYLHNVLKEGIKNASASRLKNNTTENNESSYGEIRCLVFELSSYMLEKVRRFRPHIALITNLSSDHLDRYANLESYGLAKCNVFQHMNDKDFFILNLCNTPLLQFSPLTEGLKKKSIKIFTISATNHKEERNEKAIKPLQTAKRIKKQDFSSEKNLLARYNNGDFFIKNNLNYGWQKIRDERTMRHRYIPTENILLALAALRLYEKKNSKNTATTNVSQALWNFKSPNHRMQVLPFLRNPLKNSHPLFSKLLVINDSKATTPQSVAMALSFFLKPQALNKPSFWAEKALGIKPIVLLLGGKNKGLSFEPLHPYLRQLYGVVVYGEARKEIMKDLSSTQSSLQEKPQNPHLSANHKYYSSDTFNDAFRKCCFLIEGLLKKQSLPQPPVLLCSPGCASFDQFANFEERGTHFSFLAERWMNGLIKKNEETPSIYQ